MRPRNFYTIFELGRVTAIVTGADAARKISPHRAYKRFKCRVAAEEFAAWWNHANDTKAPNVSYRHHPLP